MTQFFRMIISGFGINLTEILIVTAGSKGDINH